MKTYKKLILTMLYLVLPLPLGLAGGVLKGLVTETMTGGGYTYLEFEADGEKHWAATMTTKLEIGEEVQVNTNMEMRDFYSPSMDRTFPVIYFVGAVKPPESKEEAEQLPPNHPQLGQSLDPEEEMLTGKILSHTNAARYTYLELLSPKEEIFWVAVSLRDVQDGTWVKVDDVAIMENFTSKALNKTFDLVLFAQELEPLNLSKVPGASAEGESPLPSLGERDELILDITTIQDRKDELEGKILEMQGIVIKYNEGILGRNWIHISNPDKSGDITITTKTSGIQVGKRVQAKGRLSLNRDFGSGYVYDVLLEDAEIKKMQ